MIKNYLLLLAFCYFSSINAQIINIPDANFKAKLLQANADNSIAQDSNSKNIIIDTNGDSEIQLSEALNVYSMNVSKSEISSLIGIKNFTNLNNLYCSYNQIIDLDLQGMSSIINLACDWNQINNIKVSGLTNMIYLFCENNKITSLDLNGCNELKSLHCGNNPIESLEITAVSSLLGLNYQGTKMSNYDVNRFKNLTSLSCSNTETDNLNLKDLINLKELYCSNNKITNLDLTDQINLNTLSCFDNLLTNLDGKNLSNLEVLSLGNDGLTSIDFSNSKKLIYISLEQSSLKSLDLSYANNLGSFNIVNNPSLEIVNLKNGSIEKDYSIIYDNNNLRYVCVDDEEISNIESFLEAGGQLNVNLNTYCTFVPGGENYIIKGEGRVDLNNNGCDSSDTTTNLKFYISDGLTNGTIISNTENFLINVPSGNYTITPKFEKPDYFNVLPSFLQVEFPVTSSPFIQDFCIIPLGTHHDLEITLIPILEARPGFNSVYKIVYKNKGNKEESGTIKLSFDDKILNLISSNHTVSNQSSNSLSWNFSNLKPFESKEIVIILKLNSPLQTPAVNNGDILKFIAEITSTEPEETPEDNIFELNQTVVGSYDPNDKTCLEGDVVKPELIGEYVHYLIRFENTGTYPAENVVIKDMIDLSKFDISTLVPTSASHSYVTKISDGNKVEFIFEKINLPFDDANNDGYIAFKIKTLPTLNVGDTFENEANIYFDYNFPILTNKTISTFKVLGTQDFEFSTYFNVYPNPVKDILNISKKDDIEIQSVAIFDILGQVVIAVPNAKKISSVDVSKLQTGSYILKVKSDKGVSNFKFIKR